MKRTFLFVTFLLTLSASVFCLPSLIDSQLFKTSETKNLNCDLAWEDIDIQQSNDTEKIHVEVYCNKEKYAPTINFSNSTIYVKSNKNKPNFGIQNLKCTVIIKIPASTQFKSINFETTSGDIQSQIIINANTLSIKSTSGDQSFTKDIFAQNATFKATSGDVFVDSLYGQNLKAETTSGSIKFNTFEGQNASLGATSGSIKLINATIEKTLVKTSSGSITIEGTVSNAFDITATSGTIGLELDAAPSAKSRITSTSGTIFLGLPGNDDFSLWVQTTGGSFTNAITKEKISDHANYKQNINDGGALIMLSSTSGRITVDSNNGITGAIIDDKIDKDVPVVSFDDPIF